MLLGITQNLQQRARNAIKKNIGLATAVFFAAILLPFLLYALFEFSIIPGKSPFSADIQEPVAKVITETGVGTAFLINPTTLLTARHVLQNKKAGDQVDVIFEHSKKQYQVKATIKFIAQTNQAEPVDGTVSKDYFLTDVAVLQIAEINDIEPLILGDSGPVENLNEVILVGYPNGDYSITKGSINSSTYQGINLFKLDAASNPGNSGGPCILKEDNTVIGILVGSNGTAKQGENIALKIDDVKKILQKANIAF